MPSIAPARLFMAIHLFEASHERSMFDVEYVGMVVVRHDVALLISVNDQRASCTSGVNDSFRAVNLEECTLTVSCGTATFSSTILTRSREARREHGCGCPGRG